jgi:hypothetical protein
MVLGQEEIEEVLSLPVIVDSETDVDKSQPRKCSSNLRKGLAICQARGQLITYMHRNIFELLARNH